MGVERQRGLMLGVALPVGVGGFFFLQVSAVGEHDLGELACSFGAVHRTAKAEFDEPRKIPTVIDVGVGQHDRVDAVRRDRKACPVLQPQLLSSLEQPAVDQDATLGGVEEGLAARHGLCAADECQCGCCRRGCHGSQGLRVSIQYRC